MKTLVFPNKQIRAKVICDYLLNMPYRGCVCFSCGNASAALKAIGLDVIDISPTGDLLANRWWTQGDIARTWPDRFDATSGHLPISLMQKIGVAFAQHLNGLLDPIYEVPCGSGETLVCLKLAYPGIEFIAVYDNSEKATQYSAQAPLNGLVKLLAKEVIIR